MPTNNAITDYRVKKTASEIAYYGAYLNLAQHNAYLIINDLNERLGKPSNVVEEKLHKSDNYALNVLQDNTTASLADKRRSLAGLLKGFPFLRVWVSEDADNTTDQALTAYCLLSSALTRLNEERNQYSHLAIQANPLSTFHYHPTQVKDHQETLDKIKDAFITYLGSGGSEQREIALRKYPELDNEVYKSLVISFTKPYMHFWNKEAFSEKGLEFFTCLFLTKKQANQFISSLVGLKDARTARDRMMRALFTHYACHLPQPRLESSDVLLDMLNELSRCPKELYALLSEEAKKQFHKVIDYQEKSVIQKDEADNIVEIQKLIRYDDRFPYFALRYFDETDAFPKLRFQVYLGKLVQQRYTKTIKGEKQERILLKEIHAFGKYQEYQAEDLEKQKNWKIYQAHDEAGLTNPTPAQAGEIVQYSPHYNFSNNRIAFKLEASEVSEIQQASNKKGNTIFKVNNEVADGIISTYELPNLFLYHHLCEQKKIKGKGNSVESFLESYINQFRRLQKAIQTGTLKPIVEKSDLNKRKVSKKDLKTLVKSEYLPYDAEHFEILEQRKIQLQAELDKQYKPELDKQYKGIIKCSHLPDTMRDYLLGFYPLNYRKEVLGKLRNMQQDTAQLLRQMQNIRTRQDAEPENKRTLKDGKIAAWLAKDMVYLKPYDKNNPKNQGKPNNDDYNQLQAMLAQYRGYKDRLNDFFIQIGLVGLDKSSSHPFLEKVNISNTLLSFYESYLKKREEWLGYHKEKDKKSGIYEKIEGRYNKNLKKFDNGMPEEEIDKLFGHLFAFKLPPKSGMSKTYIDPETQKPLPIMLPRGLFNDAISKALGLKAEDNMVYALDTLLQKDTQTFYHLERNYTIHRPEKEVLSENLLQQYEKQIKISSGREQLMQDLKSKTDTLGNKLKAIEDNSKDKDGKINPQRLKTNTEYQQKRTKYLFLRNFRDDVLQTEQQIRFTQTKDRILWLMTKDLTKHRTAQNTAGSLQIQGFESWSLANLEKLLDTKVEMSVDIYDKSKTKVGTVAETRPIKDYGDLRKFAKDRRLPHFFEYFNNSPTFSQSQLERALVMLEGRRKDKQITVNYDRITVLEKALALEEVIHKKYDTAFEPCKTKAYPFHRDYLSFIYNDVLFSQIQKPNITVDNLAKLRDRFMHNEVPTKREFGTLLNQIDFTICATDEDSYCAEIMKQIIEKVIGVYDDLINQIEGLGN